MSTDADQLQHGDADLGEVDTSGTLAVQTDEDAERRLGDDGLESTVGQPPTGGEPALTPRVDEHRSTIIADLGAEDTSGLSEFSDALSEDELTRLSRAEESGDSLAGGGEVRRKKTSVKLRSPRLTAAERLGAAMQTGRVDAGRRGAAAVDAPFVGDETALAMRMGQLKVEPSTGVTPQATFGGAGQRPPILSDGRSPGLEGIDLGLSALLKVREEEKLFWKGQADRMASLVSQATSALASKEEQHTNEQAALRAELAQQKAANEAAFRQLGVLREEITSLRESPRHPSPPVGQGVNRPVSPVVPTEGAGGDVEASIFRFLDYQFKRWGEQQSSLSQAAPVTASRPEVPPTVNVGEAKGDVPKPEAKTESVPSDRGQPNATSTPAPKRAGVDVAAGGATGSVPPLTALDVSRVVDERLTEMGDRLRKSIIDDVARVIGKESKTADPPPLSPTPPPEASSSTTRSHAEKVFVPSRGSVTPRGAPPIGVHLDDANVYPSDEMTATGYYVGRRFGGPESQGFGKARRTVPDRPLGYPDPRVIEGAGPTGGPSRYQGCSSQADSGQYRASLRILGKEAEGQLPVLTNTESHEWVMWYEKFVAAAKVNRWTYDEMGLVLARKVSGSLQQAFVSLPDSLQQDYNTLCNCANNCCCPPARQHAYSTLFWGRRQGTGETLRAFANVCLLYTSDAADE